MPDYTAVASTSSLLMATFCDGERCVRGVVCLVGVVRDDGSWTLAFHNPANPLLGDAVSGEDPAMAALLRENWRRMAAVMADVA